MSRERELVRPQSNPGHTQSYSLQMADVDNNNTAEVEESTQISLVMSNASTVELCDNSNNTTKSPQQVVNSTNYSPTSLLLNTADTNIVRLNVGGQKFDTSSRTLTAVFPNSKLALCFSQAIYGVTASTTNNLPSLSRDKKGRFFLDRDPQVFQHLLNLLRTGEYTLPPELGAWMLQRVHQEAHYWGLYEIAERLKRQFPSSQQNQKSAVTFSGNKAASASAPASSSTTLPWLKPQYYVITLGYRGTFAAGRDSLADLRFRKLARILVCGRWSLCKEVFGDTLNDSRDPDRGPVGRYSSRFFLKHCILERAFETLYESGFSLVGCCASNTCAHGIDMRPGQDFEENRWQHYNEFVFVKSCLEESTGKLAQK